MRTLRALAAASALGTALASPAPAAPAAPTAPAAPAAWPRQAVRKIAADGAAYAPADLKRILARHAGRYMDGVEAARAADDGRRSAADHRAAAARGARTVAERIRALRGFEEAAYGLGAVAYEAAQAIVAPGATPAELDAAARKASFLGFPADPFADPVRLAALPLPAATPREAYDSALTLVTRLFAWTWKRAGGDVRAVPATPEEKGPYPLRE